MPRSETFSHLFWEQTNILKEHRLKAVMIRSDTSLVGPNSNEQTWRWEHAIPVAALDCACTRYTPNANLIKFQPLPKELKGKLEEAKQWLEAVVRLKNGW